MGNYIKELMFMSKGVRRFIATEALLGIGIGIYVLVFNLHLLSIGLDEAQIGRLTSMGTLIIGIFSIPSGLIANRLGRKSLLVAGLMLIGIGYGGIGLTVHLTFIYFFQAIISIGITLLITSEIQLLFYYSRSKKEETQAFSMLFAIFTLFTGVGTLLGGYIPKWFEGHTSNYQGALLISALFLIVISITRWILLPKEEYEPGHQPKMISLDAFKKQIANRSIWNLSLFIFLIGASFAIVIPFLNIIVKYRLDWGDGAVSLLLTINGLFLFIGSISMPYILDRFGIGKSYFIVFSINILLSILLFFTIPTSLFAILLLIRGGSFTMLNNLVDSQTMQVFAEDERNLFAGMRSVSRSIGSSMANLVAGIILASKNYYLPFLISGILLVAGYIYFKAFVMPFFEERLSKEKSSDVPS